MSSPVSRNTPLQFFPMLDIPFVQEIVERPESFVDPVIEFEYLLSDQAVKTKKEKCFRVPEGVNAIEYLIGAERLRSKL